MSASDGRGAAPWIWSRAVDLAVFGGSAVVALSLVAFAPLLAPDGALPIAAFFALVVGVDVAHVWSTLYRTYLDREELRRRPMLYFGLPAALLVIGILLHLTSVRLFWRCLAYVAVFHFVRQQAGWVAIYRARAGGATCVDRVIDDAAIYASTLFPMAYWHAHVPRAFDWFVDGDLASVPGLAPALPALAVVWGATLVAYAARAIARRSRPNPGKHLVVATTAATWLVGIVVTNSDFQFTAANVIVHGVPYLALLWFYLRERVRAGGPAILRTVARGGVAVFVGLVVALAFLEELAWDRLVWHARPELFGGAIDPSSRLSRSWLGLVVPLLALPQATHYALDAVLWRRKDTGRAQARALGFTDASSAR